MRAAMAKVVHGEAPRQRGFSNLPSSRSQLVPEGEPGRPPSSGLNEELLGTFTSFGYQPGETKVMSKMSKSLLTGANRNGKLNRPWPCVFLMTNS